MDADTRIFVLDRRPQVTLVLIAGFAFDLLFVYLNWSGVWDMTSTPRAALDPGRAIMARDIMFVGLPLLLYSVFLQTILRRELRISGFLLTYRLFVTRWPITLDLRECREGKTIDGRSLLRRRPKWADGWPWLFVYIDCGNRSYRFNQSWFRNDEDFNDFLTLVRDKTQRSASLRPPF